MATRTDVENAYRRMWKFTKNCFNWSYQPHATTLSAPVKQSYGTAFGTPSMAPLVCLYPLSSDSQADLTQSVTSDAYGSYRPLRIKGPWAALHQTRKSQCRVDHGSSERGTKNVGGGVTCKYELLKRELHFIYQGKEVAWYMEGLEIRWAFSNGAASQVRCSIWPVYKNPRVVVVWPPDRLVDDVSQPCWVSNATNGDPAPFTPCTNMNAMIEPLLAEMIDEMSTYFSESDGGMADACREGYNQFFRGYPSFWMPAFGVLPDVDEGMKFPGADAGHWIHHYNANRSEIMVDQTPTTISTASYISRTSRFTSKIGYMGSFWPNGVYCMGLEAMDRLLRYGNNGLDGDDGAIAWLERCDFDAGKGVRRAFFVPLGLNGWSAWSTERGVLDNFISAFRNAIPRPNPPFWDVPAGLTSQHWMFKGGLDLPFAKVHFDGLIPHMVFTADWLGVFSLAAARAAVQAYSANHSRKAEIAQWAWDAVSLLIDLQIQDPGTYQHENQGGITVMGLNNDFRQGFGVSSLAGDAPGSIVERCAPHGIGAYQYGYDFNASGWFSAEVQGEIQTLVAGVVNAFPPEFDYQEPYNAPSPFGEANWFAGRAMSIILSNPSIWS